MTSPISVPTRRAAGRSGAALAALATLVALWLGLTAPSVSPVAPVPSPVPSPVPAAAVQGQP